MEIPFYDNVKDFKENFILDKPKNIDFLEYLRLLKTKYENELNRAKGYARNCLDRLQDSKYSDLSKKHDFLKREISKFLSEIDLINFESEFYLNYTITDENGNETPLIDRFYNSPKLLTNEKLFYEFIKIKNEKDNYYNNVLSKPIKIAEQNLILINEEINREKINIFRFQNNSNQNIETEPLTTKQVQKIGLLIRSGIIDFLREKNPKISDNQIAKFIYSIGKEPFKNQSSINPHLSKSNKHYAIQNKQDKDDLDLILKQFGISPQGE